MIIMIVLTIVPAICVCSSPQNLTIYLAFEAPPAFARVGVVLTNLKSMAQYLVVNVNLLLL